MRFGKGFVAALALSCSFGGNALAKGSGIVELVCRFKMNQEARGYVSETVMIVYQERGWTADVMDEFILAEHGAPLIAKIADKSADRITFVWEDKHKRKKGGVVRVPYRLSFFPGSMAASMATENFDAWRGRPVSAQGTCTKKAK